MTSRHGRILIPVIFAVFFLLLTLTACNGARPTNQPTDSTLPVSTTTTPPEPSPLPSPTTAPGEVWLVAPPGSDAELVTAIEAKLAELTPQNGYTLEQAESLSTSQLNQNAILVVWIGDNPDIANLAGAAPETQFVLIGSSQVQITANLSLISLSPERVSFIAGFIATLVAPDRRSGGLFSADDPLNAQLQDSFSNGGAYLCGRCTPLYAPVVFFPVTASVSPGADLEAWKAGFDSLDQNRIEVLYIPAAAVTTDFMTYLNDQGVVVVSNGSPPDGFTNQWVATVTLDPAAALAQLWPKLFEDDAAGTSVNAPILITNINGARLTPGKLEFAQKVAADLDNGWIQPLSVP